MPGSVTETSSTKPMPINKPLHRLSAAVLLLLAVSAGEAGAQSLRGSRASMARQNSIAKQHDYTFLRTSSDVSRFVDRGYLVPIRSNSDFELAGVSFPYARTQVRTFIQRLSSQYRAACGERLVVTSLTRPQTMQPRNASNRSVHPTGMAIDLRVSDRRTCRTWLERTLMSLEGRGVLDATREYRPPHYHIALFPSAYDGYVAQLATATATRPQQEAARPATVTPRPQDTARAAASAAPAAQATTGDTLRYRVRSGDSLWDIARAHSTTVNHLREINNLRSSRIYAGQVIEIPAR